MQKFDKPTTGAFVLKASKADDFFKMKHRTSADAMARFDRFQSKKVSTKGCSKK
ncbi:hypothetical protein HNP77_000772 [Treponema rectale]|uniref:Uncharacterized protein n=1 Tax=Treponema rectale TaxID=744512 RepID=A0A840SE16_9SPIR|nr:hypothetical protein [Treponema rectale]MBB5218428.1 hypothetical protein [Treponema rectale]